MTEWAVTVLAAATMVLTVVVLGWAVAMMAGLV